MFALAQQHHDWKTVGDAYYNRVLFYYNMYDYKRVISLVNQYRPFLKQHKLYTRENQIKVFLIFVYSDQGLYEMALSIANENYQDALNRKDIMARINNCEAIGNIYASSSRREKAARYFDEAIRLMESKSGVTKNEPILMYLYILEADNYTNIPDFNKAKVSLDSLYVLLKRYDMERRANPSLQNFDSYWAWYYSCLSTCMLKEGRMDEAERALGHAHSYAIDKPDKSSLSFYYSCAKNYYIKNGQYEKALACIDSIKSLGINADASSKVSFADYAHIYRGLHQYRKAVDAYEAELSAIDSLSKARYHLQTEDFKKLYKIDFLQYLSMQEHANLHKLTFMAISIGVVLIVALIVIIKVYRYRKKLLAAKSSAEKANLDTSRFLDNFNRGIRKALQIISTTSDRLITEKDVSLKKQYAHTIRQTNDILQRVIYNVLDISKISSDKMLFVYETVNIPEIIGEVVGKSHLLSHPAVTVETHHIEKFSIETDRVRLKEVMDNLLFFLVFHSKDGTVSLDCEMKGGFMCCSLCSSTLILSAEVCAKVFFRQVQEDKDLEEMGLDMVVCRMLVEKMKGTIHITSKPVQGTLIVFTLPTNQTERES